MIGNSTTVVWVNPVPKKSSQGRDRQMFTEIDPRTKELVVHGPLGKTRGGGATVELQFTADYNTGQLRTGLNETIVNPFKDTEGHIYEGKEKITKQQYFEIIDQTEPGFYSSKMNGNIFTYSFSKNSKTIEPSYLEQFKVTFYDRPNRFDDSTPRGRMAIQLIKNHPAIAPNKQSINNAYHLFYVSEENEAAQEQLRKQELVETAIWKKMEMLKKADEMTIIKVVSLCLFKDNIPCIKAKSPTKELVKKQLNVYLSSNKDQMLHIDRFTSIYDMLNSKEGRQRLDIKYLIQQGINFDVLSIRDGYLFWNSKSNVPNMYKFTDLSKFENFILSESIKDYDDTVTNYYKELSDELVKKGVRIE